MNRWVWVIPVIAVSVLVPHRPWGHARVSAQPQKKGDPDPRNARVFRVLILYDSQTVGQLPGEQQDAIRSRDVSYYLHSHCSPVSGRDGRGGLVWDVRQDEKYLSPEHVQMLTWARPSLPWIHIDLEGCRTSQPLPKNVTDVLRLLERHGGK